MLIPRFSLRAAGARGDEPAALAPLPGGRKVVGEVSLAADAQGVRAGMELGEALARCPSLRLVTPDPARAAESWEALLRRLEGVGAAVESERPGEAFFAVKGLLGIHGGTIGGVISAAREAARMPVRIAVAPNRFAAFLAADRRSGSPHKLGEVVRPRALRRFLSSFPIWALSGRLGYAKEEEDELLRALARLGLDALGKLAELSPDQVADRFGPLGLRAWQLTRGEDEPLRPRTPAPELAWGIELPDGAGGPQLGHALRLLVDRLLADPRRKGRTVLALHLTALLDGGGSWSVEQGFGRPTVSAQTIESLLAPRFEALPRPAVALRLRALSLGPPVADQLELASGEREGRRDRLAVAVREVRASAGAEALLKAIDVDLRSRLPERRMLLVPFPER